MSPGPLPAQGKDRRWRFAAGALVPVAIAAAILLSTGGGDGARSTDRRGLPALAGPFSYPQAGISGRTPAGWSESLQRGVVRLTSADHTAVVGIESISPHGASRRAIVAAAVVTLSREYRKVSVVNAPSGRLAGLPADSAVIRGVNDRGVPVRILISGASGRVRTYLLDVFTSRATPTRRLVEAQTIILSLRLTD